MELLGTLQIGLGLSLLALAAHQAEGGAKRHEGVRARQRHLLLDDRLIGETRNARLAVGPVKKHPANPLFREDKPWEPRFDNLLLIRISVDKKIIACGGNPKLLRRIIRDGS